MNLFRLLFVILLAFTFLQPTKPQNNPENSLLWKINHPKTEHNSYLFGTMHALPEMDFSIPKILTDKILESAVMYQEVDISSMVQIEVLNKMM